jgi:hypothetical protein
MRRRGFLVVATWLIVWLAAVQTGNAQETESTRLHARAEAILNLVNDLLATLQANSNIPDFEQANAMMVTANHAADTVDDAADLIYLRDLIANPVDRRPVAAFVQRQLPRYSRRIGFDIRAANLQSGYLKTVSISTLSVRLRELLHQAQTALDESATR